MFEVIIDLTPDRDPASCANAGRRTPDDAFFRPASPSVYASAPSALDAVAAQGSRCSCRPAHLLMLRPMRRCRSTARAPPRWRGGRPPRARAGAGTGGIRLTDSRPKVWMHSSGDASAAKSVTTCASTCAMRHVTRTVRRPKAASSRGGKGAERLSFVWCAHWPRIRRVACRGHGRLSVPGVRRVGRIVTP